ncbi:hypothetical protein MNV49_004184 [Pseudohyphozyma bogoriensis]|nr:hypothetical protein MNV49_004184 [Pseudohyphozyma bogoriensis]
MSRYAHKTISPVNAGVADQMGFISTLELSAVRELFEINFFSLVSILTHAVPYLKSSEGKPASQPSARGRVILVSSGAATGKTASWGPYNASKAAMNSLGRTLASEEPDIVTVAVRPGVVDTSMQLLIRESGQKVMTDADYKKFKGFHEAGELLKPSQPGGVIAGLALTADSKLSGTFVNWNDEGIAEYTLAKL